MFNAILDTRAPNQNRLGAGVLFSIAAHLAVAALVLGVARKPHTPPIEKKSADPIYVELRPRQHVDNVAPKNVGPSQQPSGPKIAARPSLPAAPVPDQAKPEPKPPVDVASPGDKPVADHAPSGAGGNSSGDMSNQAAASEPGGLAQAPILAPPERPPEPRAYHWNPEMKRPVLVAGAAQPAYPRNALQLHREGTVVARCRIMANGSVQDCTILSGDALFRDAVLETLVQQRYRPMMLDGRAVSVSYDFRFHFKLQ